MSDESIPGALPMPGGWASKQPKSPGAAENENVGDAPAADCWASQQPKSPGATDDKAADKGARAERFASFGALLSAFIASSWCWLPPLLILGGISGAGMVAFLQDYRPLFMIVTFGFLGAAFYLTYRPRRTMAGAKAKMMNANRIMLWAVTVIAVVFLFFPQTVTSLFASSDEFTPDMHKTVIAIEGMTWYTWAPKAEKALKSVPGVLAVKVDYKARQATIGTAKGQQVPAAEILATLNKIKYRGRFVDSPGSSGIRAKP